MPATQWLIAIATVTLAACSAAPDDDTASASDSTSGIPDLPDDGFDAACQPDGAAAWSVRCGEPDRSSKILALAVAADGQIVVLGETLAQVDDVPIGWTWLLALDAAGTEQWQTTITTDHLAPRFSPHLAIDADGFIYVQDAALRRFDPNGALAWKASPRQGTYSTLAVLGDGVFVAGIDLPGTTSSGTNGPKLGLHRYERATGAPVWEQLGGDHTSFVIPTAMVASGTSLIVLGFWRSPSGDEAGSMRLAFDGATGVPGQPVYEPDGALWGSLVALPSGDLVIATEDGDAGLMRRIDSAGALRWSLPFTGFASMAVAADETIVLAINEGSIEEHQGWLRGVSSAGALAWETKLAPHDPAAALRVTDAAVGPGLIVAIGVETDPAHLDESTGWIRKIDP